MNKTFADGRNRKLRLEEIPLDRIPWKDMKVGGIYRRKNGKYFIYAGRSYVYHISGESLTQVSEPKFYSYIYIDYPTVLTSKTPPDTLKIIANSAKIRTSEYRDIARSFVDMMPGFSGQTEWRVADFMILVDPQHVSKGSTKHKVKFSSSDSAEFKKYRRKSANSTKPKAKSKQR